MGPRPREALRSLWLLLLAPLLLAASLLLRRGAVASAAVLRPFQPLPGPRPVLPLMRGSGTRKGFSLREARPAAVTYCGLPIPFYGDIVLSQDDERAFFPDLEVYGHYKFSSSQSADDSEVDDGAVQRKDQDPARRVAIHN